VTNAVVASLPPRVRDLLPPPPQEKPSEPKVQVVSEESSIIETVKKASPAVVSIVVTKDVPVWEQSGINPFGQDDFFRQFFEGFPQFQVPQYRQKGTEKQEVGAGTGFLVSDDGYIVTNRHVVEDEQAEYTAITVDGAKYPATVLARDPSNDIAVLKIDATGLAHITLADSDALQVGQRVIAIGYALGRFGNTVSTGIISGLQRAITASSGNGQAEDLFDVIQTDTAINPGNSGGPLLNVQGQAIGVNVAIVQGSQNIGFALPINDVKRVVESVRASGKISRPFLGVRYVIITPQLKEKQQLPVDYGALIVRGDTQTDLAVVPGSPADKAGIAENDIILEVAGKKITAEYPLAVAVRKFGVGDVVELKVLHRGEEKVLQVTLIEKQ
jgi:serine protease Do